MTIPDSVRELLMKYLEMDRQLPKRTQRLKECFVMTNMLATFSREVAEQAIMIADLERMASSPDHLRLAEKVRNFHFESASGKLCRNPLFRTCAIPLRSLAK